MEGANRVEVPERGATGATDAQRTRADWRSSAVGSALVMVAIGLWLAISAGLIDYDRPALALICAVVIGLVGLLRLLVAPGSVTLACLGIGAGALTVVTALVADETTGPTMNLALMGAAAIVISLVALTADTESPRRSRA